MKQWYESLFENYAKKYDKECYVQGTSGECDFIEEELNFNKNLKIIDIGCGPGRHSIELSKRGYKVTGIDLSKSQLAAAKEKARQLNLKTDFKRLDVRKLPFRNEFNAALMLCEGGFPLMETDEMNFTILKNATRALKNNGKFISTTLNGLFPLYHSVKNFCESSSKEGNKVYKINTFDLMTFRDRTVHTFEDDSGNKKELKCDERYYIPSEITWLLNSLGFKKIEIFGAKLGAFSRKDKLTPEDFEMLIVAEK